MDRQELIHLHGSLCFEAVELMQKKNADYAYGDDPFANFRMFGDEDALMGLVFRLGDKLRRLYKAAKNRSDSLVVEETVLDTALDIINYTVLYVALEEEICLYQSMHKSAEESPSSTKTSSTTARQTSEQDKTS